MTIEPIRFADVELFAKIAEAANKSKDSPPSIRTIASNLAMSYTHISERLKSLEKSLQQPSEETPPCLLDRPKGGGCVVTEFGEAFLAEAAQLLEQFNRLRTRSTSKVPRKNGVRVAAPNVLGLHLLPRALEDFLANGPCDVTVLESRELTDGIRLLEHAEVDIVFECTSAKLQVEHLECKPLPCQFRHCALIHMDRFPDLSGRVGDYITLSDLDAVPVVQAVTPILASSFASPAQTRIAVPTLEAARRHAELGQAVALGFNLKASLGIPSELKRPNEIRGYLEERRLALKWFTQSGRMREFTTDNVDIICLTKRISQLPSTVERLRDAVSRQCEQIAKTELLLPWSEPHATSAQRQRPNRRRKS